jgi:carbon-monoxide dehydrogenase small subunit
MLDICLNVNGKQYSLQVQEKWTLLHVLRDSLKLTGTKFGCGTGDCGGCKVLIDGEAKNSCTILAKNAQNYKIVTIEGLSDGEKLHPVQEAFIEAGAIQCGFCTPGMVISTVALLDKKQNPNHEEIVEALDNNLCRCTGYKKIVDAVEIAASKMTKGGKCK